MADLPKIVRQRLRQRPGEVHPDADLLTAFAERALGERERAQVLDHLAACAACREVVALARPQEEGEEAAAAPQGARGWVLRWQTAAALVTVAVAAVVLLTIPDSYFRAGRSAVQVAKAPAEKPAAPAGAPAAPEAQASRQQAESKNGLAPSKKEAAGQGGGLDGGVPAVLAEAERRRRDESKDKLSRSLPAAPPKEGEVATLTAETPKQGPPPATYDNRSAEKAAAAPTYKPQSQPAAAVGGVAATPGVAPPPPEAGKVTTGAPVAADQARAANETVQVVAETVAVAPLWRTSAAGRLERSPDAGRNWHAVAVSAGAVWNAVAAVGERVWVGGHRERSAVLYYSADGGAHWTRLEFTAPAGTQAANIVALNFTDAQHGVMTVVAADDPSLRQIWTSADGGHSWTAPPVH